MGENVHSQLGFGKAEGGDKMGGWRGKTDIREGTIASIPRNVNVPHHRIEYQQSQL